ATVQIFDVNPDVVTSPFGVTTFVLDLNGDSIGDFEFYWGSSMYYSSYYGNSYYVQYVAVYGFKTIGPSSYAHNPLNRMIGADAAGPYGVPFALYSGVEINASGTKGGAGWIAKGTSTWIQSIADTWAWPRGNDKWATINYAGVDNRYLGLKFEINGSVHYGWVMAKSRGATYFIGQMRFTIKSFAYNDEAGAPITTVDITDIEDQVLDNVSIYSYAGQINISV
ncbi:MAG: hypothetical protein IH948_08330, partial [Bacteroidetes bacterium]|nr:hypothetical protein [Bacteroidota bacterium]